MAFETPRQVDAQTNLVADAQTPRISIRGPGSQLNLHIDVTAATGTLDVAVEWSPDGGTTWHKGDPADTFTQIMAVGAFVKSFDLKAPDYRLSYVVLAAPDFTFTVDDYLT